MTPFFTIIIATYNREDLILKAIKSVTTQSYSNWELVVIDDGSTDQTKDIIKSNINDSRVRYYLQKNKGRSSARNSGINKANGQYLCFLDSDDYYLENHLSDFYNLIKTNNFKNHFYYGNTKEENENGISKFAAPRICKNNYEFFFFNSIGTPRTCIQRENYLKNKFNPSISIGEDTDLWLRLMPMELITHNKYTQVFLNHLKRSVNESDEPIRIDLAQNKAIYRKYNDKIRTSCAKEVFSYSYLKLARYALSKNKLVAIIYSIYSLILSRQNWKEKVFLIKQSILG